MKLFHKRKCKAAENSTQNLVKAKIGVRSSRFEDLQLLQKQIPDVLLEKELRFVAVNFELAELEEMRELGGSPTTTQNMVENSWKEALSLFGAKHSIDAVFLKLQADELREIERSILALCFMRNCPAVILTKAGSNAEVEARHFTASTLPVCTSMKEAVECLKTRVPRILLLRDLVQDDISQKVAGCKKVNIFQHFGKRAAVALIPLAVQAVNFAGVLRLVKRMMHLTGMITNKQVANTVGKYSAVATLQAAAIDQLGDVYQYAVAATILADMGGALVSEGVSAAMATLDVVDMALLGSVSLLTGMLSAMGAYLTRPQLVEAISKFLATLQVIYLLNPSMRRPETEETPEDANNNDDELHEQLDPVAPSASESSSPLLANGTTRSDSPPVAPSASESSSPLLPNGTTRSDSPAVTPAALQASS